MSDNQIGVHDVYGTNGKLLFLGMHTFVDKVVKEGACLACGTCHEPGAAFNQEHIIPRWLMVHAGISSDRLNLMNGESLMYGEYKIPICAVCNSELGASYEDPISQKLKQGFQVFSEFFQTEEGRCLTYQWLCLLLIKCMLKDCRLTRVPDRREGLVGSIGEAYSWHRHHHLLCVARSAISGTRVDSSSIGSLFLIKAKNPAPFDFGTVPAANAIRIQVGDIVLIGVLDDAGFADVWMSSLACSFPEEMNRQQIVEFSLMASIASMELNPRPEFGTNWLGEESNIVAQIPTQFMIPAYAKIRKAVGPALYRFLLAEGLLGNLSISVHNHISRGEWTFFPEALGGKQWEGVKS